MAESSKNKTRVSVTIIPMVNALLEKVSQKTGKSKSSLVEDALKEYLEKQLNDDVKALSEMDFSDLPSEDEWLNLQSETT